LGQDIGDEAAARLEPPEHQLPEQHKGRKSASEGQEVQIGSKGFQKRGPIEFIAGRHQHRGNH